MAKKKNNVTLNRLKCLEVTYDKGSVSLAFEGYDECPNVSISLTKENVKWLRTALKQANTLAFK